MHRGTVAVLIAACCLMLLAGCNDSSESQMAEQLLGQAPAAKKPADATGEKPAGLPATAEPEAAAEAEPVMVDATIEMLEVKAPYPEFVGAGNYDIKISVVTEQYAEPEVFRIVALDAAGAEVGSQERHLVLPIKKARSFDLNSFYCKSKPEAVVFYHTNKEAVAASEAAGETPNDLGQGRGVTTGGGSGNMMGGSSSGGGADEGGGDGGEGGGADEGGGDGE